MAKLYEGDRHGKLNKVLVHENGETRVLDHARHLRNHNPRIDWGVSDSAGAQLAIALLADVFGATGAGAVIAGRNYQQFNEEIVSTLRPKWRLTEEAIRATVNGFEKRRLQQTTRAAG